MAGITGMGGPGDQGLGQMFGGGDQGNAMEASFKEFINRPENRPLMEKQQRMELTQAVKAQDRMAALEFRDKVLASEFQSQKNILPFLEVPVLRRLVQTFCNDPRNDFDRWAMNPRVIEMLEVAKCRIQEGKVTEAEMERVLIASFQDPAGEAHEMFKRKTRQVVRLPTEHLVGALNEHLEERRKGNQAYRSGKYTEALEAYERAQAIVEFVQGLSSADQEEVDRNKVFIYLNLAACYNAMRLHGIAASFATKALALQPTNIKGLLRRARAYLGRHEYAEAEKDICRVKEAESWNWEAEQVATQIAVAKRTARAQATGFADMFIPH